MKFAAKGTPFFLDIQGFLDNFAPDKADIYLINTI